MEKHATAIIAMIKVAATSSDGLQFISSLALLVIRFTAPVELCRQSLPLGAPGIVYHEQTSPVFIYSYDVAEVQIFGNLPVERNRSA